MTHSPQSPILSVVGFAVAGLFSFALVCVLVILRPHGLSGEETGGFLVAVPHLTTLGWISSLLFAATYLVSPLLSGSKLWSRRLPAVHLLCHLVGLGLLIGGLSVLDYQLAGVGAALLLAGFLLMLLNVYQTASLRSLWTPANLSFHSAMFWLIVTGVSALLMLYGRAGGKLTSDAEMLLALHVQYGLFGFLGQVLLAASLRLVPEMLQSDSQSRAGDRFGWTGWALLNGGLLLLLPIADSGPQWVWPLFVIGAIIVAGIVAFIAQIAIKLWQGIRRAGWPELTHATGLLLLLAIVSHGLARFPAAAVGGADELREWMRLYIALTLLGPFAFAILGVGQRMLPRLIWALRFAPWTGYAPLPRVESLVRGAAGGPVYFSLVLAWLYLAYGQWYVDVEAIRLAAVLMLMGAFWFIVAITPSIHRFVLGVTPQELGHPRAAAAVESDHQPSITNSADTWRAKDPEHLTVRSS
jgi:hypothetical protein